MYTYFLQRRSIRYPPFIGRREDCGTLMQIPSLIQGGMGVGVSNWQLARAVSGAGQLGVIAGTGLDGILARRLQDGDPGGHMRRALSAFPFPESARRILNRYFIPGGLQKKHRYRQVPFFSVKDNPELNELTVAANFAETWLAKESQNGVVGVNYLEKVQLPTLASIYGALLAGIDYIIMGAGIPRLHYSCRLTMQVRMTSFFQISIPQRCSAESSRIFSCRNSFLSFPRICWPTSWQKKPPVRSTVSLLKIMLPGVTMRPLAEKWHMMMRENPFTEPVTR